MAKAELVPTEVLPPEALSSDEKRELRRCEAVIRRGWDTFLEVGKALATIQKSRLYRDEYRTFEAYARQRWQYGKSHAHRLIGAAEFIERLSPIGEDLPLPSNEAQVRPLLLLPPDDQLKAWKAAVEKVGKDQLTAKVVREVAESFSEPKPRTRKKKKKGDPTAIELVEAALKALPDVEEVRRHLEALREALSKES